MYKFLYSLLLFTCPLQAQNLSFTPPVALLPQAVTDKAPDLTHFKGGYFVTWKAPGNNAPVHASYLGKHQDTTFTQQDVIVSNAATSCAPVLQVLDEHLYLFWIAADGTLKYIKNDTDTSLAAQQVYTVKLNGLLANGLTTTAIHEQIVLASHANDKSSLVFALLEPGDKGLLQDAQLQTAEGVKAAAYPFIVSLTGTDIRFCWQAYKGNDVYYADYNLHNGKWGTATQLPGAATGTAPALYHVYNAQQLFYLWNGAKNDPHIYYATANNGNPPTEKKVLPPYFNSSNPVAICEIDANNFMLAYTGNDQHMYLSYFAAYNPASWMQDLLHPAKEAYTLKDIVIPGAHDAGMSVLNGTGGQMKDAINTCNTLTQSIPIKEQLQNGIRMFDLRVGNYAQALYIKHAESDCDVDAVGAGYGEKLADVLSGVHAFLETNKMETVMLNFSHFCDQDVPTSRLADTIIAQLGAHLYRNQQKKLADIKLKDLAGKVIVVFEQHAYHGAIDSCSIANASGAFINYRRKYAATNDIKKMLADQVLFFNSMKEGVKDNDLIRLDWQLTQSSQEAALICNGFRPDRTGAVVSGVILLTNALKKNQTILDLSAKGNRYLLPTMNDWISNGTINKKNKPNILYVDAAGSWITDYCIDLNMSPLYTR